MNFLNMSALDIAQHIANGSTSSVAVTQFFINRIESLAELNCISDLFAEQALAQAQHLDDLTAQGKACSIFHGTPIILKDSIDVAGHVSQAGTVYLSEKADTDASLVQQLKQLGFVILAKAKMTELAFGLSGQNPQQGTPHNPWATQVVAPGGSSSGCAVAIAAGLSPLAIGGDTGGSIRAPAAFNGIFGFKPSQFRIDGSGTVPLAKSLDTLGPMSLHFNDLVQLYLLLSNQSLASMSEAMAPIYYLDHLDFPAPLAPEIMLLWQKLLEDLSLQGVVLKPWIRPQELDFTELSAFTSTIIAYESYRYHGDAAENPATPMWQVVRERVCKGKLISADEYQTALQQRAYYQQIFKDSLGDNLSLLLPASPLFATDLDELDTNYMHVGDYTRPFNYLDAPACSFPIGFSKDQLPIGVQLVNAFAQDQQLLSQAQQLIQCLNIEASTAELNTALVI